MHVYAQVQSDTDTHATQLCNASVLLLLLLLLLLILLVARLAVGWAWLGERGGEELKREDDFEGPKSARQAVSVSYLIAAAARENDGMQQHTFGIRQGSARPGGEEADGGQHQIQHNSPAPRASGLW